MGCQSKQARKSVIGGPQGATEGPTKTSLIGCIANHSRPVHDVTEGVKSIQLHLGHKAAVVEDHVDGHSIVVVYLKRSKIPSNWDTKQKVTTRRLEPKWCKTSV